MFLEFFDWLCNSLSNIFDVMKRFVLFEGFNYYNFCIALFAIPILIKLIHFIMQIEDEEIYYGTPFGEYEKPYDYVNNSRWKFLWNNSGYKPRHRSSYRYEYIPKHEEKGRHGKL